MPGSVEPVTAWLAISNSGAGTSDEETVRRCLAAMREHVAVDHVATADPDDLDAALADHPDARVVVAMGGDGSIHAVVQALFSADRLSDSTVALVPLGTGNDFARTLDLPEDPVEAARAAATGVDRPLDLIVDGTGKVVVNAAHVGIGAEAAARARPMKKILGPVAYALGALSTLFTPSARLQVRVDDRRLSGRIAQVAVGNGRFVGGGGELLPHASVDDGVMDVAVAFASTTRQRILYALHLRRGDHPDQDFVEYTTARTVEVRGEDLRCTTDGELSERLPEHRWRIVPAGWTMRLPQATSTS